MDKDDQKSSPRVGDSEKPVLTFARPKDTSDKELEALAETLARFFMSKEEGPLPKNA